MLRPSARRLLAVFLAALLLLAPAAAAATPEESAQTLHALGLFRGTDQGFELARTPKRSEALVILVRLLGGEADALAGSLSQPFADVPAWFAPYAAHAYRAGLTKGAGEDAAGRAVFGTYNDVSRTEFLTFILRALGYEESAGDFIWSEAETLAAALGLLTEAEAASPAFTRGDCAVIALRALSAACKTGGTLADRLVDGGVLSREAALAAGAALTAPQRVNTTDYTDEAVLSYFEEIAFDSEYGGYVGAVRKWTAPIYYEIHGTATSEDLALLARLCAALNAVDGFPGIHEAAAARTQPNLHIYFMAASAIPQLSDAGVDEACWGLATAWWYTATKVIHSGRVAIANDEPTQLQRSAVILEEMLQVTGLMQDSYSYPESLFYQGDSDPQWPPELDWALVRLLYSARIRAGMDVEEAMTIAAVILEEQNAE